MRVLQISSDYHDTTVYRNLFSSMEKQIVLNTVVPLTIDKEIIYEGITIPKNVISIFQGKSRIFGVQINSIKYAKRIVESNISSIDLIHAHYVLTDGSIALKLYKKLGIPYVVSVRSTCISNFDRKIAIHNYLTSINVLLNAKTIFFQSPNSVESLLQKVPKIFRRKIIEKHVVIPNGIDDFWHQNKYSQRNDFNKKEFTILTAASIEHNKNLISTSKAISSLNEKGYNIDYHVAGAIKDKTIFNELKLLKHFKYLGVLNRQELLDAYRKSDIFVMLSHHETFGLVYAEAMSQGAPIVYSKNQGFDGQFDEGFVGFHASPLSIEDIEASILKVVNNYKALSENAVKNMDKFNWDFIAFKYISIYSEILNRTNHNK